MLDFHSHLMPAVDDGAADIAESRAGLAAITAQGVTSIITTPHFPASLTARRPEFEMVMARIDSAWTSLAELASAEFPTLRLARGVELALDIPKVDLSDSRLRLAGTSFVLLEFPHMSIPPASGHAIRDLRSNGWRPIIAHPERYSNMSRNFEMIETWKDAGAFIQVNAGSIVGQYGSKPKELVWEILQRGWADYVCSDFHSKGRLGLEAASEAFEMAGAAETWDHLVNVNAFRILDDELPLPVEPLIPVAPSIWDRLLGRRT